MSPRIVTVTLNPAIDEAIAVESFVLGEINRCDFGSLDAGGKGLNASRVIHRLGRATIALGFVGGVTGAMIRAKLDDEGVPHAFDDVEEMTRLNVMLFESGSGRRSRIYLPGARVDGVRLEDLRERLASLCEGGIVVLGGSLPPGLPVSTYRELVRWLYGRGIRTLLDASGRALAEALEASPLLVKPDVEEASALLGRQIENDADAFEAARELRRRGAENVVVSQGAAGAVAAGPEGCWKAVAPCVTLRSAVGSGDSMVAGLAIALNEGRGLVEGLRLGTAAGAGTAMTPAAHLCRRSDFERLLPEVKIHSLEGTMPVGAEKPRLWPR
ncbi:MAG TPA: 1-phosphofructokinase [Candidatus Nitrosotalea sp.]|nr:1-phosphofructokinase [Candidatus Nitrosotalea sp.]